MIRQLNPVFWVAVALIAAAPRVQAATFTVRTLSDAGMASDCPADPTVSATCSLRGAILAANAAADADTIQFSLSGTITSAANNALPAITQPLSIDGTGQSITVSATVTTLLRYTAAGTYSLKKLTLTNGQGPVTPADGGGGIYFGPTAASTLSLTDVTVSNCSAGPTGSGGGLRVTAGNTVTMVRGSFMQNTATAGNGGGISTAGTININNTGLEVTTFFGNTAQNGGAIHIAPTGSLNMTGGTVGNATAGNLNTATGSFGGGIYNDSGNLTLSSSLSCPSSSLSCPSPPAAPPAASGCTSVCSNRITGSAPGGGGGGIASLLGTSGSTVLDGVTLSANSAGSQVGGGLYAQKQLSSLTYTITNSTLSGNLANSGAGLYVDRGRVTISRSTLSGNDTRSNGGGDGGGIMLAATATQDGAVALSNCTLSGNFAGKGGGIGVAAANLASSSMVNCTISNNVAVTTGGGAGIGYNGVPPNTIFPGDAANNFTNNIIAKNYIGSNSPNALGPVNNCSAAVTHNNTASSGYNISDDASCGFTQTTDRQNTDPKIGALDSKGGPTQTHNLLAGSPAIDAGNTAPDAGIINTDQRGAPQVDGDENISVVRDIGAYEYAGFGAYEYVQSNYSITEPTGGTDTVTLMVRRFGNVTNTGAVNFRTVEGTGQGTATPSGSGGGTTDPDDYTVTSGTLNFGAGDNASKSFTVTILPDILVEPNETINLALSIPSIAPGIGADIGPRGSSVVTIMDREEGRLRFNPNTYSVGENVGPAMLTVTRTNGSAGAISVSYQFTAGSTNPATGGSSCSTAGVDYINTVTPVTWADGDATSKTITVPFCNDAANEPNETFSVTLNNPTGGAVLDTTVSNRTASVTITNDDPAQNGQLEFTMAGYSLIENGGAATISVRRVNGTDGSVSVTYATSNGSAGGGASCAAVGADYVTAVNTLSWSAGDSANQTFTVTLCNDSTREADETVNLTLSQPMGGATLGPQSTAVLTILTDEKVQFQFSNSAWVVDEQAGNVTISVEPLQAVSGGPVTIAYTTSDGSATAPSDYTATSGTLTWNNGEAAAKSFTVPIIPDGVDEGNESFNVSLGTPAGGGEVVGPNPTPVTIVDTRGVRFTQTSFSSSGESGSITVTVQRIGPLSGTMSVNYATSNGTATAGSDYTTASGALNWGNNDGIDKTFSISLMTDTAVEGNETINLALSAPQNAVLSTPSSATATILDDDYQFVFNPASYTVGEGAGAATLMVERRGGFVGVASVTVSATGGTAGAGDYSFTNTTLNWPDGQGGAMPVTVNVNEDSLDEDDETVTFGLSNPSANGSLGTPSTATLTITDNDLMPTVFIDAGNSAASVAENAAGVANVRVRLSAVSGRNVTVPFATGGSASSGDYSISASPIVITAGNLFANIAVDPTDDAIDEDDESVQVVLQMPVINATLDMVQNTHTLTILDNDLPPTVTLSLSGSPLNESGGVATVIARLSATSAKPVTVNLTFGGTATNGSDYTRSNTVINIPAGITSGSITLTAVNDTLDEANETVVVDISTVINGTESGTQTVTGTIIDDDNSVTAGDQAPAVVVTPSGNVAATSGNGGGAFSWTSLLGLLSLLGLRRRSWMKAMLAFLVFGPVSALAQNPAQPSPQGLSYSNVDLRYLRVNVKDPSVNAGGFSLAGSWAAGKEVFLSAGYSAIETDDSTVSGATSSSKTDAVSLGLGWHRAINSVLDFSGSLSLLSAQANGQGGFGSSDDTGYGLEAGLRGLFAPAFEWGAALNYVSIFDDSDTALTAQGLYHFDRRYALFAGAGIGDNSTQFNLGARYSF